MGRVADALRDQKALQFAEEPEEELLLEQRLPEQERAAVGDIGIEAGVEPSIGTPGATVTPERLASMGRVAKALSRDVSVALGLEPARPVLESEVTEDPILPIGTPGATVTPERLAGKGRVAKALREAGVTDFVFEPELPSLEPEEIEAKVLARSKLPSSDEAFSRFVQETEAENVSRGGEQLFNLPSATVLDEDPTGLPAAGRIEEGLSLIDLVFGDRTIPTKPSAELIRFSGEALREHIPNAALRTVVVGLADAGGDLAALALKTVGLSDEAHNVNDILNLLASANKEADKDVPRLPLPFGASIGPEIASGAVRSVFTSMLASPGGPAAMIGLATLVRGNQALTEGKNTGLSPWDNRKFALRAGIIEGGIAGIFQKFGLGGAESLLAGKAILNGGTKAVFKALGKQTVAELTEENLTEILDSVNVKLSGVDEDAVTPENLWQTVATTTAQTLLTLGFGAGNQAVLRIALGEDPGVVADEQEEEPADVEKEAPEPEPEPEPSKGPEDIEGRPSEREAADEEAERPVQEDREREEVTEPKPSEKRFPVAPDAIDGRRVINKDNIPNQDSISAELDNFEVLSGVREVQMSEFSLTGKAVTVRQNDAIRSLQDQIEESGEITPLIVVVDDKGPFILEGATRVDALFNLGAKSFPAQVVIDRESLPEATEEELPFQQQEEQPDAEAHPVRAEEEPAPERPAEEKAPEPEAAPEPEEAAVAPERLTKVQQDLAKEIEENGPETKKARELAFEEDNILKAAKPEKSPVAGTETTPVKEKKGKAEVSGEELLLSRPPVAEGGTSAKQVLARAKEIIANWVNGPNLVVVQSQSELPKSLRENLAFAGDLRGAYRPTTDTAYLIADNIGEDVGFKTAEEEAEFVFWHEVLGHRGIEGVIKEGKTGEDAIEAIAQFYKDLVLSERGDEIMAHAQEMELPLGTANNYRLAAKEWMADRAAKDKLPKSVWAKFVALVKKHLGGVSSARFSDEQLDVLAKSALQLTELGATGGTAELATILGTKQKTSAKPKAKPKPKAKSAAPAKAKAKPTAPKTVPEEVQAGLEQLQIKTARDKDNTLIIKGIAKSEENDAVFAKINESAPEGQKWGRFLGVWQRPNAPAGAEAEVLAELQKIEGILVEGVREESTVPEEFQNIIDMQEEAAKLDPTEHKDFPKTTSGTQAGINEAAIGLGADKFTTEQGVKWNETIAEVRQSGDQSQAKGLAESVVKKPRILDVRDTAILHIRRQELSNLFNAAKEKILTLTDPTEISTLASSMTDWEGEFMLLSEVQHNVGSEVGRALAFRKLVIDENFDILSVVARAVTAKGETLTKKQRAEFDAVVNELAEKQKELDVLKKAFEERTAETLNKGNVKVKKLSNMTSQEKEVELKSLFADIADMAKKGCNI